MPQQLKEEKRKQNAARLDLSPLVACNFLPLRKGLCLSLSRSLLFFACCMCSAVRPNTSRKWSEVHPDTFYLHWLPVYTRRGLFSYKRLNCSLFLFLCALSRALLHQQLLLLCAFRSHSVFSCLSLRCLICILINGEFTF